MEFFDEFKTAEAYGLHLMHSHAYREAAALVPAGRVLDLGCNNGYGSFELSRHGHRVVGVDVSAEALDDARRRFSADNLDYRQVSGQDLPFEADSFDLITSFQVIEHIVEMEPYLREIRRVLKPGGLAVFTTPNARIRLDPGMRPWNRFHVQEFTPEHLKETVAPFFAEVRIRGLYASEELYATEFNRCQRALTQAREAQRAGRPAAQPVPEPIRDAIAAAVKAVLPARAVEYIRTRRDGAPAAGGPAKGTLTPADRKRLAGGSIYYRDDGLDKALDLMAVCRR
ncbi:class I SAM-dependent methyltransferase (plasmid) [Skermanella mucosa]|uniref:class I SAM-dependent methyltransferase n=1 Tax=Skermanella mucosa TaxID=1789672 RepID=UPI00192B7F22|nr:class I SAM-dependent methyltransferase [Skermanella mucosa]UEM24600.1 class I SAM-dependent methyltransferase [Skermanella mucosa]